MMHNKYLILPALLALSLLGGCSDFGSMFNSGMTDTGDEEFAILLMRFNDPANHMQQAQYYKDQTEADAHWQGLFILTSGGGSSLYWGKYLSVDRAKNNLQTAKAWKSKKNHSPYTGANVVPLPGNDIGPAEWNLRNLKCMYSVQVAIYYNVPEANYYGRRKDAVEICRRLRQAGEEAYFFHDASQSSVWIGSFGKDAIKDTARPAKVPPGANPHDVFQAFETVQVIVDPKMKDILARHQVLIVNGGTEKMHVRNPDTHAPMTVKTPTRAYKIDQEDRRGLGDSGVGSRQFPTDPSRREGRP